MQICRSTSLQRKTLKKQRVDVGIDPYMVRCALKSGRTDASAPTGTQNVSNVKR